MTVFSSRSFAILTSIGAAMVNLIGAIPDTAAVMAVRGGHIHLYGKDPRPGRKVGHVTLNAEDAGSLDLDGLANAGVEDP